ncbi:MAG TPA: hypothetical protein DIW45_07775 [Erythrobacter sp.]|nr:hypothetical protein [Erythrobacter sp.]
MPLTAAQKRAATGVLVDLRAGGAVWQHNGDCINADAHAGHAWKAMGGKLHLHPPTHDAKRAFQFAHASDSPRPYLDRNSDIVEASDVLVAMPKEFNEELRSGTWATVRRARKRKLPIIFVWPDGSTSIEWPAQAMDARSAETTGSARKGDSAVA